MMESRLQYVRVKNNSDMPYMDMFDGVPVTIDPGGEQNIRPEQAFHFFGWCEGASRNQMILHTAKRKGWNTAAHLVQDESGRTLAERLFDQLVIEPVTYKLVEEAPAADQPIPADPEDFAKGEQVDEEVETAPPPPKFAPVRPQAKPAAKKSAPKRSHSHDDDE